MLLITGKKFRGLMGHLNNMARNQEHIAVAGEEIKENLHKLNANYYVTLAYIVVGAVFLAVLVKRTNYLS